MTGMTSPPLSTSRPPSSPTPDGRPLQTNGAGRRQHPHGSAKIDTAAGVPLPQNGKAFLPAQIPKRLQLVEDGGGGLLQRKRPAGELQNRARVGQTGLGEPSGGLPQIDPHARHHGQPALPVRPTLT